MMNHNERKYLFLINFVTPVTRVWGILTVVVFWGVGVDVALHGHKLGIYIIDENKDKCFRCWKQLQWLDQWRKSLLYLGMSVLCFIRPSTVWLAIVAGVMLITLAILYLLMTCREKLEPRKPVLFEREASYDRFNDLQDEIDDSLPEPGNINESHVIRNRTGRRVYKLFGWG
ncbi:transmembrane protein 72-like isoform X3 [Tachypleus tridentatus]|uniref:transmembrane protein 72-like isoform X3 n=1 Tax=Tachypleus tridentatus TaxID=6853 RepID=UPI003FD52BF6